MRRSFRFLPVHSAREPNRSGAPAPGEFAPAPSRAFADFLRNLHRARVTAAREPSMAAMILRRWMSDDG